MWKSVSGPAALVAALLVAFAVPACDCGGAGAGDGDGGPVPPCTDGTDLDGDRYGEGCPAGDDCDDFDPNVNTNCPDANCEQGIFQGCPCDPATATTVSCYDGPDGTSGNPPCGKGMRSCDPNTNTWSACGGQVLPEAEVCDEADNDCDGATDEGVQSSCGNCLPSCDSSGVDTDPFPFPPADPDVTADGVGLDPNGDLVLDSSTTENHFIWVANAAEGTVSKIDTRTGREVARYATVQRSRLILGPGATGNLLAWNAGNQPSRTAIDFKQDVWVANRAHNAGDNSTDQASATKIFNSIDDCTDFDGDGTVETSADVNGDGRIDINSSVEFLAEADECIAFTVALGPPGSIARALAVDAGIDPGDPGDAWVGLWGGNNGEVAFYELNGRTGAVLQRVPSSGNLTGSPYGAAIDSQGRLWAAYRCCGNQATLLRIDTRTNPATFQEGIVLSGVTGTYGVTVDASDRVWIGPWTTPYLKRYDPATNTTVDVALTLPGGNSGVRLRGVGIDTHGNVWGAIDQPTAHVVRVDADNAVQTGIWALPGATTPVGVGVDFDGNVWTVNQNTSNATRLHIDQTTLDPAPHPTTSNQFDNFPTGPNPYTYSDFTGLGLRTVTRPTGDYAVPIKGCSGTDEAIWVAVEWDATTPPNTRVEIFVQVGDDKATLSSQTIYGPWTTSPADLTMAPGPVPDAQWMLLTIRLISEDGESSPIVHGYEVQWGCPGPDPG